MRKVNKSDTEWKDELTTQQYRILRKGGTERAFTGEYYDFDEEGIYRCAACGNELFPSDTKFHSGSGWPSFYAPAEDEHLTYEEDRKLLVPRTEVRCAACGSHLGHVFDDGPPPTGKRYCINSAALSFDEAQDKA